MLVEVYAVKEITLKGSALGSKQASSVFQGHPWGKW